MTKLTLTWNDLFLMMERDKNGRWFALQNTPAHEYISLNAFRYPSYKYPHSHSKPLLTKKFAKWLIENHKETAVKFGLVQEVK